MQDNFIKSVLKGGEHHFARIDGAGVFSIEPRDNSEKGLKSFHAFMDTVLRKDGNGYRIILPHFSASYQGAYLDQIVGQLTH